MYLVVDNDDGKAKQSSIKGWQKNMIIKGKGAKRSWL